MIRQARTGDTVLVKYRDDSLDLKTAVVAGGRKGIDDRKLTINVPLFKKLRDIIFLGGGESLYDPFRGTF